MTCHDHPGVSSRRRLALILSAIFLMGLPLSVIDLEAEFLLQSARHFEHGDLSQPNTILVEDVTGDDISDIVLPHRSFNNSDRPMVVTFPGLGDGFIGAAVNTVSPFSSGDTYETVMALVNGDQQPDLLLNMEITGAENGHVLVLLGNGDGSFTVSDNLDLGHDSYNIVGADFTGDGIIDFAVNVNDTTGPYFIHTFQGAGDGTFTEHGTTSMAQRSSYMATGDFDDDGDIDIVATIWDHSIITLLLNNGSGEFTTNDYSAPGWITSLDTGDINGDGFDDLAAAYHGSGTVGIFFGNADGTLSPYVPFDTGRFTTHIVLGDLENDGDLDIAVNTEMAGSPYQERVAVLLNDGAGSFSDPEYFFRKGYNITLGDMDGNGALDAVMNGPGTYNTSILLGMGNGKFQCMTDLLLNESVNDISCVDVDLDGDQDLAASNADSGVSAIEVRLNNGDGTFADPATYDNGNLPFRLDHGDINGDGYPEIIFTSNSQHILSILQNAGDGTFVNH